MIQATSLWFFFYWIKQLEFSPAVFAICSTLNSFRLLKKVNNIVCKYYIIPVSLRQ